MTYTITWRQAYTNWVSPLDNNIEDMLQYNNFEEALEVISKIKSTL